MALSDFDPRYLELWRDGAVRPVRVPQKDRKAAVTMRHRLYRCRSEMVKEKHEYADQAGRVSISIVGVGPDNVEHRFSTVGRLPYPEAQMKWALLLDNTDATFDEALTQAGYVVPEAPEI